MTNGAQRVAQASSTSLAQEMERCVCVCVCVYEELNHASFPLKLEELSHKRNTITPFYSMRTLFIE